jgi:hypothetical protein
MTDERKKQLTEQFLKTVKPCTDEHLAAQAAAEEVWECEGET